MRKKPLFSLTFDTASFGRVLELARSDCGYSAREAGEIAEQSKTHILRIEGGRGSTVNKLLGACLAAGVPPGLIFADAFRLEFDLVAFADSVKAVGALRKRIHSESDLGAVYDLVGTALSFAVRLLTSEQPSAGRHFAKAPESMHDGLRNFGQALDTSTIRERASFYRRLRYDGIALLLELGILPGGEGTGGAWRIRHINPVDLRQVSPDSPPAMKTQLFKALLERVRALVAPYGKQSELARYLGVSRQTVSDYINGVHAPSAENTLRMLQWANTYELQKKDPTGTTNTSGALAPKPKKPTFNEKPRRRGRQAP